MEMLFVIFVGAAVVAYGFAKRNRVVNGGEASLCLKCAHSVVARGTRGEGWIACNYGGAMRAVKFTVCSCSRYCEPSTAGKLVAIAGFVRDESEVYAEVAIS